MTASRWSPTRRSTISCLTTDQLKKLWSNSDVTNYSQLGNDADTGDPLPDADVSLYGPGTDSGTFDYFTDVINGEEDLSRKDYQPSEDDNVLVQGVSGDAERARLLRVLLLRAEPGRAQPGLGRRRQGLRRAEHRDDPVGRLLAALAAAVHVPVDGCARSARRSPRSSSSSPTTTTRSPHRRWSSRWTPSQGTQGPGRRPEGGRLRPLEGPPAETRAHGGSRHSGGRRGAGGESPRRPPPPLGRGGDPRGAVPRRRDLGPDDDPDRRRAAQGVDPVLQGRRLRLLHRQRVVAAVPGPPVRRPPAAGRDLPGHRDRDPGRGPGRARLGDLPLRVRDAARRAGSSSRSSRSWSACRRSSSATSR